MTISGEPLKILRKADGLTLEELEEKSGVSKRTIAKIEKGIANPSYSTLVRLADAFQVPLDLFCARNIANYNIDDHSSEIQIIYKDEDNNKKLAELFSYFRLMDKINK